MMATLHNHPLPLTLADLEFDRMTQANVFNHRIHTIKGEATTVHTDDVRSKLKKKHGKRVSWGKTQIKEIEPFKNVNYWQSVGDKETAGIEKRCEQFWERGRGHRFGWTINDKRWNRCSQIWDEMDELIAKKGVWDTWDDSVFKGGLL
mgnify:FL=1